MTTQYGKHILSVGISRLDKFLAGEPVQRVGLATSAMATSASSLPYANSATKGFPEAQLDDPDDEQIGPALCVACLQQRHNDPYEAAACECDCHNKPLRENKRQ